MKILLFILLFFTTSLSALTLKSKFVNAQDGDYIVTEQNRNYSLLFVRAISEDHIIFEEITVPVKNIDASKMNWNEWLSSKAPGHTSWISYEIDLNKNSLKESFSYTQNGWLYLQDSDYLLAKLLNLPLERVQEADRRRIGPAPSSGENDTRALWNPSLVVDGKKIAKPKSEVWRGKWPDDKTLLAGCSIDLYFDTTRSHFPFPYWIEIQSTHYALKVRTIDSGTALTSPMPLLPHKTPVFLSIPQKQAEHLQFRLRTPSYYQNLNLYAIDLSSDSTALIPLPTTKKTVNESGEILLETDCKNLNTLFIRGHFYRFIVIAEEDKDGYAETSQPFLWN
ncbi:MAG: hypothetical protein V4494_07500 [Chlamydiota bacterium]